jgi:hypothetical protein
MGVPTYPVTVVALFSVGVWLFTVIVMVPEAVTPLADPLTVTVLVPTAVGVPEIIPVVGERDNPVGRPLPRVYAVGTNPPDPVGAAVAPAEFRVRDALVKLRVGAVTVREKDEEPVPEALVARMVTLKVPVWLGIPEITPVSAAQDRPVGKPAAEKEVGELSPVMVYPA